MDIKIKLKSGAEFIFGTEEKNIVNIQKGLNKLKFIRFGTFVFNTDAIEYIEQVAE